jgi:hypothetical protein
MTGSCYKGRSVKLRFRQEADGRWVCAYTIVEFMPTHSFKESGYPVGSFATRDQAETAALAIAQSVINVRDPIGESVLV